MCVLVERATSRQSQFIGECNRLVDHLHERQFSAGIAGRREDLKA